MKIADLEKSEKLFEEWKQKNWEDSTFCQQCIDGESGMYIQKWLGSKNGKYKHYLVQMHPYDIGFTLFECVVDPFQEGSSK